MIKTTFENNALLVKFNNLSSVMGEQRKRYGNYQKKIA
jgi:hypothetical protein